MQDRVPAFSVGRVRDIIRAELGAGPEALFAAFDDRPLAAASLGQVHRATLRDGSQVVVKVQRPGLKVGLSPDQLVYPPSCTALRDATSGSAPILNATECNVVFSVIMRNCGRL